MTVMTSMVATTPIAAMAFLTVEAAASRLGVSNSTMWRLLRTHQIECTRLFGRVLFTTRQVEACKKARDQQKEQLP